MTLFVTCYLSHWSIAYRCNVNHSHRVTDKVKWISQYLCKSFSDVNRFPNSIPTEPNSDFGIPDWDSKIPGRDRGKIYFFDRVRVPNFETIRDDKTFFSVFGWPVQHYLRHKINHIRFPIKFGLIDT